MLIATEVTKVSQDSFNLPTTHNFHFTAAPDHSPVVLTLGETSLIRSDRPTGCQAPLAFRHCPARMAAISGDHGWQRIKSIAGRSGFSRVVDVTGQKTLVAPGVVGYDLSRLSRFLIHRRGESMDWRLADAKNRFSELVTQALTLGPQRVRRFKDAVIVISERDYERISGRRSSFKDYLSEGEPFEGLEFPRDFDPPRESV